MRRSATDRGRVGCLPGFWPGLGLLSRASRATEVVLLDHAPFQPGAGLHRARIRTGSGETWLSLPLRGAAPGTPLRFVELAGASAWAPRFMRVVEHAYEDTPCFERHRCDLARLLFHGWPRLVDLNEAMLRLLLEAYGVSAHVVRASVQPGATPTSVHTERATDPSALGLLFRHGPGARELLRPAPRVRLQRTQHLVARGASARSRERATHHTV